MKQLSITKQVLAIEKNIPSPSKTGNSSRYSIIPATKMIPGDSVFYPTDKEIERKRIRQHLYDKFRDYKYIFVCRFEENKVKGAGVRIWCEKRTDNPTTRYKPKPGVTKKKRNGDPYVRGPYKKRIDAGVPQGPRKPKKAAKKVKKVAKKADSPLAKEA